MYGGQIGRVVRTAREVEELWREEFDGTYQWPGAYFHLTLHVQLIAHPGAGDAQPVALTSARSRARVS